MDAQREADLVDRLETVIKEQAEVSDGALVSWDEWTMEQVAELRASLRKAVRVVDAWRQAKSTMDALRKTP